MHAMKEFVRNNSYLEGPIVEAYITNHCLNFCSRYLHRAETRFNHLERNEDQRDSKHQGLSVLMKLGNPLGQVNIKVFSMMVAIVLTFTC